MTTKIRLTWFDDCPIYWQHFIDNWAPDVPESEGGGVSTPTINQRLAEYEAVYVDDPIDDEADVIFENDQLFALFVLRFS